MDTHVMNLFDYEENFTKMLVTENNTRIVVVIGIQNQM